MKTVAAVLLASASLCLLGCPEEKATPDPSKAAPTTTAAAPSATPSAAATAKAADTGGGW